MNIIFIWWLSLVFISILNIFIWIYIKGILNKKNSDKNFRDLEAELMIWLSLVFVLGCTFISFLPRIDVEGVSLFGTWLSSVFFGRTVATIAEIAFAAQWFIFINYISRLSHSKPVEKVSKLIIPLIILAELFSWYAVLTANYLGNVIEESIWTIVFIIIALTLLLISSKFKDTTSSLVKASAAGIFLYVLFMLLFDIPNYFMKWKIDMANFKKSSRLFEGFFNINSSGAISWNMEQWRYEMIWMPLYFGVAVWVSLGLCYLFLNRDKLLKYLKQ